MIPQWGMERVIFMNNIKLNTRVCSDCPLNEQVIGKKSCKIKSSEFCCHMQEIMDADFHIGCPPPQHALYQLTILRSIGIANFLLTYAISHGYDTNTAEDLYVLGLMSSVGYLNNPCGTDFEKRSSEIAIRNGLYLHKQEFAEAIACQATFVNQPSEILQLLWLACMCISAEGDYVGYMYEYEQIRMAYKSNKYNKNRFRNVCKITEYLKEHYPDYE